MRYLPSFCNFRLANSGANTDISKAAALLPALRGTVLRICYSAPLIVMVIRSLSGWIDATS
jgi:hypothetical protein